MATTTRQLAPADRPATAPATAPGTTPATAPAAAPTGFGAVTPNAAAGNAFGAISSFGPGNDLRTTQIAPATDARTQGVQSMVNNWAQTVGATGSLAPTTTVTSGGVGLTPNFTGSSAPAATAGSVNIDPSAEAQRARALTMQGLETLTSAPNRQDLALESLRLYNEESEPSYQQSLRSAGQKAAALGRTKSGMTTNELSDLALVRERDRDRVMRGLATETAGLEMQDRLSRVGASQSVADSFGAGDRAQGGLALAKDGQAFNQALAGAQETRYGADTAFNQSLAANADRRATEGQAFNQAVTSRNADLNTLDTLSGLEQLFVGQGRTDRAELRGERDYQNNMATDAMDRGERELATSDRMATTGQARDLAALEPLLRSGWFGDPTGAMLDTAGGLSQGAAAGNAGIMDLLMMMAQERAGGGS